ncbi:MAG: hypothetical protein M3R21_07575 [Candidatus Dormibacteraeota bacterium]|nr:hypothetical protein [Candidatus Dormibacteraeota bacterium]
MITFQAAAGQAVTVQNLLQLGPDCCTGTPSYVTFDGIDVNGCLVVKYDAPPQARPTHIAYKNAHIWATSDDGCHLVTILSTDSFTLSNVELGPMCCGADAIELGITTEGFPNPSNILIDRVYIHDIYDTCRNMPGALKGKYGCSSTGYGDNGIGDHVDGIQAFGCSTCTISNSRIYAINPSSSSSTGAAQGIFFERANGGTYSNLTFINNMVACGCGSNVFSLGSAPNAGGFSGYIKFLYNSVQGRISIDDRAGASGLEPGTQVVFAGNIASGFHSGTAGEGDNDCYFTATDGSRIRPVFAANMFGNVACSASDRPGTPTWVSTNFFTPDFHLATIAQAAAEGASDYCPSTDLDGNARPLGAGCHIGADQAG